VAQPRTDGSTVVHPGPTQSQLVPAHVACPLPVHPPCEGSLHAWHQYRGKWRTGSKRAGAAERGGWSLITPGLSPLFGAHLELGVTKRPHLDCCIGITWLCPVGSQVGSIKPFFFRIPSTGVTSGGWCNCFRAVRVTTKYSGLQMRKPSIGVRLGGGSGQPSQRQEPSPTHALMVASYQPAGQKTSTGRGKPEYVARPLISNNQNLLSCAWHPTIGALMQQCG